ncbi:MAG: GerMN domain-containing protein [Armatimonadota bacterium]
MKRETRVIVLVVLFILSAGIGAYIYAGQKGSYPVADKYVPAKTDAVSSPSKNITVYTYMIAIENDKPLLKEVENQVDSKGDLVKSAFNLLIEEVDTDDLANPIPEGTSILGLNIKDGLLTLDFSREIVDNFSGGSEDEGLLLESILKTAAQFKNIRQVQLMVEGKPLDTLGHLDFSGPLDVNKTGIEYGE